MVLLIQCPFPERFPMEYTVLVGVVDIRSEQEVNLSGESADWPPWLLSSKQDEPVKLPAIWPTSCLALWAPAFHLPCLISVSILFHACAFVGSSLFIINRGTKKQKFQSLV